MEYSIQLIEETYQLSLVEALQRQVWPGSEIDILPTHILKASIHNGGLLIGAFTNEEKEADSEEENNRQLVGFAYSLPGFYITPDGPRTKHFSHMLGVHPDHRRQGLGYKLKRAQWQMVRHQGVDRITWTYDPLLAQNAMLNIAKLGGVCNTYLENFYGEMRDRLNAGLPSDRLEIDWWVNSRRVNTRLSKHARPLLNLEQYLAAEASLINPSISDADGWRHPAEHSEQIQGLGKALVLIEIPADFQAMRSANVELAKAWRMQTRKLFQEAFAAGYLITDFVRQESLPNDNSFTRNFYVLSHGESTL
jgi:predicted GNAT superfamily acetyltransferase